MKIYNDMYTTLYDKLKNKNSDTIYGSYVIKYQSLYKQVDDRVYFELHEINKSE